MGAGLSHILGTIKAMFETTHQIDSEIHKDPEKAMQILPLPLPSMVMFNSIILYIDYYKYIDYI